MTGATQPYPNNGAPHFGPWFKGVIAVLLLIALAWVGMIAFQYFRTGKPISESSGIREIKPLARLVEEKPQLSGSIWNIARPLGVAASPEGTVYVTESSGDRLIKAFDANGTPKGAFGVAGESLARNPIYMAYSPDGKLYVSDLVRHDITIFSAAGEPLGQVASPVGETWAPSALTFDASGNLYVTDFTSGQHRVLVLDKSGQLILQFGSEGQDIGQFSFPNGIAVDGSGNIYVSDSGNGRVQAFDAKGKLLYVIGRGTANADLAMPRGITVDDGRHLLLVADTTDGTVKVYDISAARPKLAYMLGAPGAGAEELRFPNAVAIDGKGHIYVADRENGRLAVWRY